ncbi:MAG TPA: hypothetical protein VM490_09085 [Armatimonadaceae bacterium]|nr:hypothetical protein [Armatimonadaceae bacterium]
MIVDATEERRHFLRSTAKRICAREHEAETRFAKAVYDERRLLNKSRRPLWIRFVRYTAFIHYTIDVVVVRNQRKPVATREPAFAVMLVKHSIESDTRNENAAVRTMSYRVEPVAAADGVLQAVEEGVADEAQGIDHRALARAVATHEHGQRAELYGLVRDAAKPLNPKAGNHRTLIVRRSGRYETARRENQPERKAQMFPVKRRCA